MTEASVQNPDDLPSCSGSQTKQTNGRHVADSRVSKIEFTLLELYKRESSKPIRANHLNDEFVATPAKRAMIVDCMCRLHIKLKLQDRTFQTAIGVLDQYLQDVRTTPPADFIFLGIVVLFTATRNVEPPKASCETFLAIQGLHYTVLEMRLLEQQIFSVVHDFSRPTQEEFLVQFTLLGRFSNSHFHMASYFIELALCVCEFASVKQSKLSAAALLLATHFINQDCQMAYGFNVGHWSQKLARAARSSAQELRPICKMLAVTVRHAPNMNIKAVYKKYQAQKYHMVSKCTELYSPLMDSICDQP